jgi:single-strand DNA-binding protein
MANLNQVNLIGHVTRDPELRYTPKGTATTAIGLAVNRQWKTEDGREGKEATFIDVILWARLAEVAAEFLREGHPVFITGRLHQEKWIDKDTQKNRTKLIVVAEGMQLLKPKAATQIARQLTPHKPAAATNNNDEPQYPDRGSNHPLTDDEIKSHFPDAKLIPVSPVDEIPF